MCAEHRRVHHTDDRHAVLRPTRPTRRPRRTRAGSSRCRRADRRASRASTSLSATLLAEERDVRLARRALAHRCSLARSASLTQSPGAFARTLLRAAPKSSSTISPPRAPRPPPPRARSREIEVAHPAAARSACSELRCPGRDELAPRVRVGDAERTSSRVDDRAPASVQIEQPAEVVPRRVDAARVEVGRRDAPVATSHSASAADPSERNCFHGSSVAARPVGDHDHRILDSRRRSTARAVAVTGRAAAAHRGNARRRSPG